MVTITVVEPNALLRMGLLTLLRTLDCAFTSTGIDYAQLFHDTPRRRETDLMLLSVPGVYDRMIELVTAAQEHYTPRRLLLLSETWTLPYSLLNLPPVLAGYISKHASQDVLKTSVMLVLAGGKCFPHPDARQADILQPDGREQPRRRWYDRLELPSLPRSDEPQPDNLLHLPGGGHAPPAPRAGIQTLTPELVAREAPMLHLTHRQYEVLVLLAQGYPLKKISRELNISVATAKTHAEALYQRLAVNSRNAAVYAAVSRGATLGWHDPATMRRDTAA
ncbi:response regulator transcription factor [Castellaniella defragrans]|uniref:DNA-binding NarL/FixJ family response regulator n=1 Tax=Castellaniella defragrans TaxID=75697 RepID=A0A7W9TPV4_CASDE|nr:LuxR C-terminal-related transcriptional regulator [Castellaniella defragrans]MBB6084509.1 DNA-binding NarL/FixJ family response regulator [Castellaniella defragrans]